MATPCTVKPGFSYTVYPCAIDSSDQLPITIDNQTPVEAEVVNRHREAIIAIESELGSNPSGTYTTVRARLDALESILAAIAAGSGLITVQDEGINVSTAASTINFIGSLVLASSTTPGVVDVYIPSPDYLSHWDTADGSNGDQSVSESISRTTARISRPTSEGSPFNTNTWAGTNQDASLNGTAVFTTPGSTTGFGGDSTMTVTVYDADGSTVLDTYTTPAITSNGVHNSGTGIIITITGYAVDSIRNSANASVSINLASILSPLDGGRYHVEITHVTDSVTDGTGPYTYVQSDVFYDTNPSTPSISGSVAISETAGFVLTKHLSGIEYYILGSDFTVDVVDIDGHNRNSQRTSASLLLRGTEYGLPDLDLSPFGTGSGNFSSYNTGLYNQNGIDYQQTDWEITQANYRYIGPTGNITGQVRDTWASGSIVPSTDDEILIDTYITSSSALVENFDDEARRQDGLFNSGTTPGNWDSTATLGVDPVSGDNEAIVFNGQLMPPDQTTYVRSDGANSANTNWTTYLPNLGGANPNYTGLSAPAIYYRSFPDPGAPTPRPNFTVTFTGTFPSNATAALAAGDLQMTIYKIGGLGGTGAPPTNTQPLFMHGATYNFALFDDGVTNGQIRLGSSSGNTVECTFGGFNMQNGVFCAIRIVNAAIRLNSVTFTYN